MFQIKVDFCGLIAATTPSGQGATPCLVIRSDDENASTEKYQPNGQNGGFAGTEVYGADSAPSNAYGIKAKITATDGMIKLGKIVSITEGTGQSAVTKKYALEKVSISTGGGQIPTLTASCQEVESDCDVAKMPYFAIPAFVLDKAQVAQDIFGVIKIEGDGCELTKADYEFACTVQKDKVEGVKIASDINSGVITLSGTILQTKSNKPVLSVDEEEPGESGWVITQAPDRKNPEAAYKNYEFEMQLVLEKEYPTPAQANAQQQTT